MKAIIVEKPSVAREIATLVGAKEKKEGYLSGNGYEVTWAFGHLLTLAMPEHYGYKGFDKTALPITPEPFQLIPRMSKRGKEYVADTGVLKQLKIIQGVIERCEYIIVATDAGREGELIFRYIYSYLNISKPFERLWISSLTEKAIRSGLNNLKPGIDFQGLYHSALARSRADWLVGINATQALTIAAGEGLYSLGRVQTPTLALICNRYLENKEFCSKPYYQIELHHQKDSISFKCLSKLKWEDQKQTEDIKRSLERNPVSVVTSVGVKTVNEQPPLLFDLTGLQKEANTRLNLSADETLQIAQDLYEKKFITYPRTGSKYIPEDLWPEIPQLIRALHDRESCKESVQHIKWGRLNKRIVNDLRVTDHHGLLITEKIPSSLTDKENAIYNMIALRMLEAVCWPCVKEISTVDFQALHYDFVTTSTTVTEGGWRMIKGNFHDEEEEDSASDRLPDLKTGDWLDVLQTEIVRKETKAPALYTEASLLAAMEHAGKNVEDAESRKILQNIGIGTPATRASIIETLFQRHYISRQKKYLVPTEKGLQVYQIVKDKRIADVSLTAQWEIAMQQIENGEKKLDTFLAETKQYTQAITAELLAVNFANTDLPKLKCPKCKQTELLIREKVVKCKDAECGWLQFRNVCEKQLTVKDIQLLIEQGRSPLLKGMKSKAGKKFDAYLVLNQEGKTTFEFGSEKSKR